MTEEAVRFEPYTDPPPSCAVWAITTPGEGFMHTYYDVCPWSPSGRLLACLRLPFEDRRPGPDDAADVCIIDLEQRTLRSVYRTAGWGFQTAAHQVWGRTDRRLYFNDKVDGLPVGVRLDLETGHADALEGTIWQVSPDETFAITTCLIRGQLTQPGYGVVVRRGLERSNAVRAAEDDGLFRTDLSTGERTLLVSLARAWDALPDRDDLADAVLYAFHCKFNPQGTRIMLVVRARFPDGRFVASLLGCRADGADLRTIVPHRIWARGGHHPIWHPDGRRVLMNLTPGEDGMRFCLVDADTGEMEVLCPQLPASGHPSISPDGRRLLTDVTREARGVRRATIRLADLQSGCWADLCTASSPAVGGSPLRRDAHPVWDRSGSLICFLAAPRGRRRLFIAEPDAK